MRRYAKEVNLDKVDLTQADGRKQAVKAYAIVYDSLPECQRVVLDTLRSANEPLIVREILPRLDAQSWQVGQPSLHARLSELIRMRLVVRDMTKRGPHREQACAAFRAFKKGESLPIPLVRGPNQQQLVGKLNAFLDAAEAFFARHPDLEDEFLSLLPDSPGQSEKSMTDLSDDLVRSDKR